jgi:hypothetical protein
MINEITMIELGYQRSSFVKQTIVFTFFIIGIYQQNIDWESVVRLSVSTLPFADQIEQGRGYLKDLNLKEGLNIAVLETCDVDKLRKVNFVI